MAKFLTKNALAGKSDDNTPLITIGTIKEKGRTIGRFNYIPPIAERLKEFTEFCETHDQSEQIDETAVLLSQCIVEEDGSPMCTPEEIMAWPGTRMKSVGAAIMGKNA